MNCQLDITFFPNLDFDPHFGRGQNAVMTLYGALVREMKGIGTYLLPLYERYVPREKADGRVRPTASTFLFRISLEDGHSGVNGLLCKMRSLPLHDLRNAMDKAAGRLDVGGDADACRIPTTLAVLDVIGVTLRVFCEKKPCVRAVLDTVIGILADHNVNPRLLAYVWAAEDEESDLYVNADRDRMFHSQVLRVYARWPTPAEPEEDDPWEEDYTFHSDELVEAVNTVRGFCDAGMFDAVLESYPRSYGGMFPPVVAQFAAATASPDETENIMEAFHAAHPEGELRIRWYDYDGSEYERED